MIRTILYLIIGFISISSCRKFVTVDALKDQLLTTQVYNDDASAGAAIMGLYNYAKFPSVAINGFAGMYSDELTFRLAVQSYTDFQNNTVQSSNTNLPWGDLYSLVYRANLAIEKLGKSTGLSANKRGQYIGEAKFLRAYAYFYLINFFGDVPLLTTTDAKVTSVAGRSPVSAVYTQIIADLADAQASLPADNNLANGSRTRANKWAAAALLARVYLYTQKWAEAETQSSAVINNTGLYSLLSSPAGIFARNNNEAILQWDAYNGQPFGLLSLLTPASATAPPYFGCTDFLLNAFDAGDQRKAHWILPMTVDGNPFYAAFKFTTTNTNPAGELETPLRLAEQYLIRAEARAMQNNFDGAMDDINLLRLKHGGLSTPLSTPADQASTVDIILHERQVELFTEGGHRWLDLKRTGRLDAVMQAEKPDTWVSTAALWPIPASEILLNPNLDPGNSN